MVRLIEKVCYGTGIATLELKSKGAEFIKLCSEAVNIVTTLWAQDARKERL